MIRLCFLLICFWLLFVECQGISCEVEVDGRRVLVGGQGDTEDVLVVATEHHDHEAEDQKHKLGAAGRQRGWAPHFA